MKIIRWAAILVTGLFALMNIGVAADTDTETWIKVACALLAVGGLVAAVGLALNAAWGRIAVIAVGALNVAGAVGALISEEDGAAVGIVVGGLAVALGVLSSHDETRTANV